MAMFQRQSNPITCMCFQAWGDSWSRLLGAKVIFCLAINWSSSWGGERNANKTDKNRPELLIYLIYLKLINFDLYMYLEK